MKTIFSEILKQFQTLLFCLVTFLRDYLDSYLKASSYNAPNRKQTIARALSYDNFPDPNIAQAILDTALEEIEALEGHEE